MNLNLSKFKKVKDDSSAVVLQHPSGHKIVISKKQLSDDMKKELSELKMHMADGGDVEELDGYKSLGAKEEANKSITNEAQDFPPAKTRQEMLAMDQASQPELPKAPEVSSAEQEYNDNVQKKLQSLRQQNYSHLPEDQLAKQAQEDVLNQSVAKKESDEASKIASEKSAQNNLSAYQSSLRSHYDYEVEHTKSENSKRSQLNLPPLAMPTPPSGLFATNAPQAVIPSQATTTPIAKVAEQQPMQPQQAPQQDLWSQGIAEQREAIGQQYQAESQLGADQQNIYKQQVQNDQAALQNFNQRNSKIQTERDSFLNDYKNQHIDPNHYLSSMGTGQKISTGIGLILGGMGAGLTHTSNPVMDFINKQISNDIDSQKMEMGKTENLLSANFKQFGNLKDATDMTRIMQNDIVSHQMKEAEAKVADPMAKARMQAAYGKLDTESGMLSRQLTLSQMGANGQLPVSAQGLLPPDLQARSVKLPSGTLGIATSKEDAEKARSSFAILDNINAGIDRIDELMKTGGRTIPLTTANQKAEDARASVILNLRQLYSLNRLNSEQLDFYEKMVPSGGAWRQEKAKSQLDELRKGISDRKASEMNNFLMGPNQAPSGEMTGSPMLAPPNLSKLPKTSQVKAK